MSENDVLHLEAHFQEWCSERAEGLTSSDAFLYYCLEQILKPYSLSDEDVRYGITESGNDGGIDAFYFLANRNVLVRDDSPINKSADRIRLIAIQTKSSKKETGFSPTEVGKFRSFFEDLLNLSKSTSDYGRLYQPHLLTLMESFKENYRTIMGNFPVLTIECYLVTRGDEEVVPVATEDQKARVKAAVKQFFPEANCDVEFVDTQNLLEFARRRKSKTKTLKWAEPPLLAGNASVGLVKLADYADFLKDENGELNEPIFESNVRGYQKRTPVNRAIEETLAHSREGLDFWLLNNGITVISGGEVRREPSNELIIEDPQVVNGLQTSREIFKFFKEGGKDDTRSVLIRVIPVSDEQTRDDIIRATNSQNKMSHASLRATDLIHRQIEASFKQHDLFYDRRKGFYKDQGAPISKIVSVLELIQALISIIGRRPDDARARPSDYLRKDSAYNKLFARDRIPLPAYLKCINITRRVEGFIKAQGISKADHRNVRFYVAYHLCCLLTKMREPTPNDILLLESSVFNDAVLKDCLETVWSEYQSLSKEASPDAVARGTELLEFLKADVARRFKPAPKRKRARKRRVKAILAPLDLGANG